MIFFCFSAWIGRRSAGLIFEPHDGLICADNIAGGHLFRYCTRWVRSISYHTTSGFFGKPFVFGERVSKFKVVKICHHSRNAGSELSKLRIKL